MTTISKQRKARIKRMMRLSAVLAATNTMVEANDNTKTVPVARPVSFFWQMKG